MMSNRKILLAVGLTVLVLFVGYLLLSGGSGTSISFNLSRRGLEQIDRVRSTVDSVIANQQVSYRIEGDLTAEDIRKSPEFLLASPESDWFNAESAQRIAAYFGFSSAATAIELGNRYIWSEGNRSLTVDPSLGAIEFSTAFNIDAPQIPDSVADPQQARNALVDFFEHTGLPDAYLDLKGLTSEYQTLTNDGLIDKSFLEQDALIRLNIPYTVSGVRLLLPYESFAVVDGAGDVRTMNMLIPNLKQTDQLVTVVSLNRAKQLLQENAGVVIKAEKTDVSQIAVKDLYFAYYVSRDSFRSIASKRVLEPVFVFTGDEAEVAVLAASE